MFEKEFICAGCGKDIPKEDINITDRKQYACKECLSDIHNYGEQAKILEYIKTNIKYTKSFNIALGEKEPIFTETYSTYYDKDKAFIVVSQGDIIIRAAKSLKLLL
jgi:DNA-directed RNA polymerase subunit RPC12/RpoP